MAPKIKLRLMLLLSHKPREPQWLLRSKYGSSIC
jgi:hypothetical protein